MKCRFEEVESRVLEAIRPSIEERVEVSRISNIIIREVREGLEKARVKAEVEVEGSVAKDTWLSGEWDLDIFVLFPPSYTLEFIEGEGLEIISNSLSRFEIRRAYAEHPYLQVRVGEAWVDVVPAFKIEDPRMCKSTVDRTPHHTRYVRSKLREDQKDDVRLLKKFMKGIGVYGAEVRVSGFSGYLVELLIIRYGSFRRVLEEASKWKPPVLIDIEGYYDDAGRAFKKFKNPMILIDPVDPGRNVASAVSLTSLSKFIAASQHYLESPSLKFFGLEEKKYGLGEVEELLESRGTGLLFIVTKCPDLHPDILWGEVKRTLEGLRRLLENWGFKVIDYDGWCGEGRLVLIFELESLELPVGELRVGPKIYMRGGSLRFLKKHLEDRGTIAGPYISGDRWWVVKRRRYRDATKLVAERWREASIAPDIFKVFESGFRICIGGEVLSVIKSDDFVDFLGRFLCKKPSWLLG